MFRLFEGCDDLSWSGVFAEIPQKQASFEGGGGRVTVSGAGATTVTSL